MHTHRAQFSYQCYSMPQIIVQMDASHCFVLHLYDEMWFIHSSEIKQKSVHEFNTNGGLLCLNKILMVLYPNHSLVTVSQLRSCYKHALFQQQFQMALKINWNGTIIYLILMGPENCQPTILMHWKNWCGKWCYTFLESSTRPEALPLHHFPALSPL